MNSIYMQEEICEIKGEKRILIYDSGVFQSRFSSIKEVFNCAQSKRGRCIGKIYVGEINARPIGWTFTKKVKYEDCNDTYLQETWITLHTAPAKTIVEYSPMYLK